MSKLIRHAQKRGTALFVALQLIGLILLSLVSFIGGPQQSRDKAPAETQVSAPAQQPASADADDPRQPTRRKPPSRSNGSREKRPA